MKTAILIEDRVQRQKKHLGQQMDKLAEFSFLENISGGEMFADIKTNLFNKAYSIFNDYSVIMLHRSAFETEVRNALIENLKKTDKKLVLFSGGISGCQISKIEKLEFMSINVTHFYSDNLILFLSKNAENLLELAFGKEWKMSILIDAFDKLTLYEKNLVKKPWDRVETDLRLIDSIKQEYFTELSQQPFISNSDIRIVLEKMKNNLKTFL